MKINEMYLIFNENNEIKEHYITTFGQAQCNLYGCISLKQEINLLKELVQHKNENDKEIDILLKKWEQSETKENLKDIDNILLGCPIKKKSFYTDKFQELENIEQKIYRSYYDTVHVILTNEEVQKIQKSINYNFMSDLFINKMIELLESKEV